MRYLLAFSAITVMLISTGCQKPPETVHVNLDAPPARPMDELAPAPMDSPPSSREQSSRYSSASQADPFNVADLAGPGNGQSEYVIQRGDNLYRISERLLGSTRRWKEIQDLNPGLDPTKLKVGQKIKIPAR